MSKTKQLPPTRFIVHIESVTTMGVNDIWPNRDWPDNPTEADVRKEIDADCGVERVIDEWNLDARYTVTRVEKP